MFTGIVRRLGTVAANSGSLLRVRGRLGRLPRGASVAVNGTCLTVIRRKGGVYDFDVSPETLRLTNLGGLRPGEKVNLEPSLKASDMIGGHLVTGHVDATGEVLLRKKVAGGFVRMRISVPKRLAKYVAYKGSIAVDGASLTVTRRGADFVESVLIPETLERTTLGRRTPGSVVNLEVDLVARYLENLRPARRER